MGFNRAQEVLFKLPLAVLAEDEHRKISFANQYFCDLFSINMEPRLLTGMDCANMAEQSKAYFTDEEAFMNFINRALETHAPIRDVELQLVNGTFLEATYEPYFKEKVFAGHIWTYKDISPKKNAEINLEQQKAFSEEILDSLPADIAIFNQDHQYLYTNYTAIKNPEMREWIKGKDDFDYCELKKISTKHAKTRRAKFIEALSSGSQIEWEDEIQNSSGNTDYILRKFNPLFDEKHQLRYMIGYGININEIKKKAEELRLSEIRYKTVVNQLKEIIFQLNDDGTIAFLNPAWEKITGYSIAFSIGKRLDYFTDASQTPEIKRYLEDLVKQKRKEVFGLLKINAKSKNAIYLEVYASILSLEGGPKGVWGTLTNVTEKKKAEKELLKGIQKERELYELKSRFVNMVSHEIRTPMAGILSSVELLELINENNSSQIKAKSDKHFGRIKSQIKRVTELMNDVLLLGKIDVGKVQYHPEKINVLGLIKSIIEQNFNELRIKRKIDIQINGKERLSMVDSNLLKHIITNLISNALKYSPDRPDPIIKLFYNDKNIVIEVVDHGIGIPVKDQKNLFTAFARASNSRNIEGTGLGLVVVKHLVNIHQGKLTFNSIENSGTTFRVTLPG